LKDIYFVKKNVACQQPYFKTESAICLNASLLESERVNHFNSGGKLLKIGGMKVPSVDCQKHCHCGSG
jgi:hypothetical protein